MTKEEIVKEIKSLFNISEPEVKVEKFMEYVLKDGTKIMTSDEELKIGSPIFVLDGENQVPAPDGEWEIVKEEKNILIVTEDGLVSDIKEVEITPEETIVDEEAKKEYDFSKLLKQLEERIDKKIEMKFKSVKDATILLAENFQALPGGMKIDVEKTGLAPEPQKSLSKDEKFFELLKSIKNK